MSKYLIKPSDIFTCKDNEPSLSVAEVFYDTIQGEGPTAGCPAIFLRLRGCTQNCTFCDSKELWKENGSRISISLLLDMFELAGLFQRLREKTHLVITGGSPLLQQFMVVEFIEKLRQRMKGQSCIIEVENEMVIEPTPSMMYYVNFWNNSPKLTSSGNKINELHRKALFPLMNQFAGCYKFVISCEEDIQEVEHYINQGYLPKDRVWLMPEGATREEIFAKQQKVVEHAVRLGVNFSNRQHIILWDNQQGV